MPVFQGKHYYKWYVGFLFEKNLHSLAVTTVSGIV